MLNWLDKKLTKIIQSRQKRSFDAGRIDRLTSDWANNTRKSADADIKPSLKQMVANSRSLSQNDDYIKKFLRLLETNVVGPDGFKLQMQIKDRRGKKDKESNKIIEAAWKKFSSKENASVEGKHSIVDICKIVARSVATDGEALVRKVAGFDNDFGFSLQMIESDHLDIDLNRKSGNQNEIRMGIEFDKLRRPISYPLFAAQPGDDTFVFNGKLYQDIPASEMIHVFVSDRIGQSRGVPWVHAAMKRLSLLGGYEEAELVAARAGAAQMGVIITPDGEYKGDSENDGKIEMDVEPGVWRSIPEGTDFKQFDPTHPSGNYESFIKGALRGISSGIGASYNSIASDAEGVNFSSLRHFTLEDRDHWRMIQAFFVEHLMTDIFESWLKMALTTQAVPLPLSRYDDFNKPAWRPRGWTWVDPVKDVKAAIIAIDAGLNSRTRIAAEQGRDIEDVFDELEAENKMAEDRKLSLTSNLNTGAEEPDADEQGNKDKKALSVV